MIIYKYGVITVEIFVLSFIIGLVTEEILLFWAIGFVSGMLMLGIGEIIRLLQGIKNELA